MKRLRKAFNLIEVIFVITIIGILAAITIPKLQEMNAKLVQEQMIDDTTETSNSNTQEDW